MKLIDVLAAATLAVAMAAPLGVSAEEARVTQQKVSTAAALPVEGTLPSLAGATTWLNSAPLTPSDLRGKVVVRS